MRVKQTWRIELVASSSLEIFYLSVILISSGFQEEKIKPLPWQRCFREIINERGKKWEITE